MPNVTIDTWDLYSEQFYIVTTLSVLLVGSSLLWDSTCYAQFVVVKLFRVI